MQTIAPSNVCPAFAQQVRYDTNHLPIVSMNDTRSSGAEVHKAVGHGQRLVADALVSTILSSAQSLIMAEHLTQQKFQEPSQTSERQTSHQPNTVTMS